MTFLSKSPGRSGFYFKIMRRTDHTAMQLSYQTIPVRVSAPADYDNSKAFSCLPQGYGHIPFPDNPDTLSFA